MEVWLQVGCEQFVITWDCRLWLVLSLVSLAVFAMEPVLRSRQELRTEIVLAARL
jgi:heme exporter protein D